MKQKPSYYRSPGFRLSQKAAEELGPAFEKLERKLKRAVLPSDIVSEAENPASPFHPHVFDVTGAQAAYRYHLLRATYIIRAIDVVLPDRNGVRVRAIIPVSYRGDNEDEAGGYMSTVKAARERPDVIELQVQRARDDARHIAERYGSWMGFAEFKPAEPFVEAALVLAAAE